MRIARMMVRHILMVLPLLLLSAVSALADEFRVVKSRDGFVDLISGKELRRLGIRLSVSEAGKIKGNAFGRNVSGDWRWERGYFCRSLVVGDEDLGRNCQLVLSNGTTLRFIADQGSGKYADLRLD